ncbi:MAG: hypothetical protein QM790_18700 [Nibricoccus sp.]
MKTYISPRANKDTGYRQRGSALLAAMIMSLILAILVGTYIELSSGSMKLAHHTFYSNEAVNLAEVGLEEAVWSFNRMGNSTDSSVIATAWDGWTLTGKIGTVEIASGGIGYTSAPTVTFSGDGTGAAGTAVISTFYNPDGSVLGVRVTKVIITNPGSGYTAAPTVTLSGGGGSGAQAVALLSATRTFNFDNLDGGATGTVKVWVAGYNGTAVAPIVVAKATIQPITGMPVEKTVEVILSKNGVLPKGLIAFDGINWNGHPFADSYSSSATPGVPPFASYDSNNATAQTTVASLAGTIDLSHGTVSGNVMTGPGVTVTGGTVTGQIISNFTTDFSMPSAPAGSYKELSTIPAQLPIPGDLTDVAQYNMDDGKYYHYYHVSNQTIGAVTITAGANVIIKGDNTRMSSGLMVQASGAQVGSATIYMDGPINLSGNDAVNTTSWAGALQIYTTTTQDCSFSGNAKFYGCLTAPNAALVGNGSGNNVTDLCGSFVVNSVTSNGHMNFHYDTALRNLTNQRAWKLALWAELQSSTDRAMYASQLNF